jgi:hypothetical protein
MAREYKRVQRELQEKVFVPPIVYNAALTLDVV